VSEVDLFFLQTVLPLAALFGIIPAIIANKKGRNPVLWWLLGAAMFIVALPVICVLADRTKKQCPRCLGLINRAALFCHWCKYEYGIHDDLRVA
jgi:hypothetical protein